MVSMVSREWYHGNWGKLPMITESPHKGVCVKTRDGRGLLPRETVLLRGVVTPRNGLVILLVEPETQILVMV